LTAEVLSYYSCLPVCTDNSARKNVQNKGRTIMKKIRRSTPLLFDDLAQVGTFRNSGVAVVSKVLCTSATLNKRKHVVQLLLLLYGTITRQTGTVKHICTCMGHENNFVQPISAILCGRCLYTHPEDCPSQQEKLLLIVSRFHAGRCKKRGNSICRFPIILCSSSDQPTRSLNF
jgi:hypothetical protein